MEGGSKHLRLKKGQKKEHQVPLYAQEKMKNKNKEAAKRPEPNTTLTSYNLTLLYID